MSIFGTPGGDEHVRFTVSGRTVSINQIDHQRMFQNWHNFQSRWRGRVAQEDFLTDLMLAELATEAGIKVTDGALREWIATRPFFQDLQGNFDAELFDIAMDQNFGGMHPAQFESEARRFLLIDSYQKMFGSTAILVSDQEAWERWKGDHPKVAVDYAWLPVSEVRATLKAEDVTDAELENHWKNQRVKNRHRLERRYGFDAAYVKVSAVDDETWLKAREEWKDDAAFKSFTDSEVKRFYRRREGYDFNTDKISAELREALMAENEKWGDRLFPAPEKTDEDGGDDTEDGDESEDADSGETGEDDEEDDEELIDDEPPFNPWKDLWRYRVAKEVWLQNLVKKVLAEAKEKKEPLKAVAARHSREGMSLQVLEQKETLDQYGLEELDDIGSPNLPMRYAMNGYRKSREGTYHGDVLELTAMSEDLPNRGWICFQVKEVVPSTIPELAAVRDKIIEEVLDEKAEDEARARLTTLRKGVEDSGGRSLVEVAKEKGFGTASLDAFNEYSWRPPFPRPEPGEEDVPAEERWQDERRRISSVMSRYPAIREVPVGNFPAVIEDGLGTGAFYLVQVTGRADAPFQEMTAIQLDSSRRRIRGERYARIGSEMDYDGLRDRLALHVAGEPAKARDAGN
ncbi:MAG: SurA N-terminal domain-containing protein, partial [Planctomycetota bacterium]|jgi:hypothetical protein